ncbi:hypothetical protein DFQ28_010680 [Apophysomyces sp. BC1034]|nr:hypothetical protein DFQ28_010680 [Apophysomyces sp. BC1034]
MEMNALSADGNSDGYASPDKVDPGVCVATLLSNYLDSERSSSAREEAVELGSQQTTTITPPNHAADSAASTQLDAEIAELSNLIWVPANKHPQIAPNEFAIWIKTHGLAQARNVSKVRRQRSILSLSYTSDDDTNDSDGDSLASPRDIEPLARSFSVREGPLRDLPSHVFDQYSTTSDDSPILFPQESRSLLRRSALSARGKIRRQSTTPTDDKEKRRARKRISAHIRPYNNNDDDDEDRASTVSSRGVTLYDQPVSMSEWIDLGSASLERDSSQHKILSRVHDAETNVLSHLSDDPVKEKRGKGIELTPIIEDTGTTSALTKTESQNDKKERRKSLRRSLSERMTFSKSEKKVSWFGTLFEHKEKKNRRVDDMPANRRPSSEKSIIALTRVNSSSNAAPPKKSGLAAFFARKFSVRSASASAMASHKPSPQPNGGMIKPYIHNYRLPLHIERGIYRLSHMKLSNPRRPLREQVLISNLMFWYLSIINIQQPSSSPPTPPQHESVTTPVPFNSSAQPHQNTPSSLASNNRQNRFQRTQSLSASSQSNKITASQSSSQSSSQSTLSARPKKNKNDDRYKPVPNADYGKPSATLSKPLKTNESSSNPSANGQESVPLNASKK